MILILFSFCLKLLFDELQIIIDILSMMKLFGLEISFEKSDL